MDELELLDPSALERLLTLGGAALAAQMVDLFLTHSPERVDAIRAGLEAGDLEAVRSAAHSLRSTAGNVGAQRLQHLAERIEQLAMQGNTETVYTLFYRIEAVHAASHTALMAAKEALQQ